MFLKGGKLMETVVIENIMDYMLVGMVCAFILGIILGVFLLPKIIPFLERRGFIKVSVRIPRYKRIIKYQAPTPGKVLVEQANAYRRERGLKK